MKTIEIILPTLNQPEDLVTCLSSLNDSVVTKTEATINVTVIDDKSTKSNREEIITNLCKFDMFKAINVEVMFMNKQCGFIHCCNAGISNSLKKRKQPDYIIIMHDDVKVYAKDWALLLANELESDLGAMCIESLSSNKADLHSIDSMNIEGVSKNYNFSEASEIDLYYDAYIKTAPSFEVEKAQLYGAMFRREAFERYGLFDENVISPINMEYEYCERINESGKYIKTSPKACVIHKSRVESPYVNSNMNALNRAKAAVELNRKIVKDSVGTTKKYVLYTFLREQDECPIIDYNKDVEFIYFTTRSNRVVPYPWKSYDITPFAEHLGIEAESREMKEFIRMHPHYFFKNYQASIFIDGVKPVDMHKLIGSMSKDDFMLALDDDVECAYEKLLKLKESSYIEESKFDDIVQLYKWCNYPARNGMMDPSILVRKHNDERCINAMNKAYGFMSKTLPRPELFLNFSLWLLKLNYKCLPSRLAKQSILEA